MPDSDEILKQYRTDYLPLLRDLSDTIEKLWLPALADGQQAFVLDAKWTSKAWHAMMPPSDKELPMLELGVVLGVSDAAKLEKALESYRKLTNKLLVKARGQIPPGTLPAEFEIPKPKVEQDGGNTYAFYPIPEESGLDRQFRPTGGLSKRVAVLTLSQSHSERLLNEAPLKVDSPVLADTTRPLDSVFYFNWAGMVDAAAAWAPYVIRLQIDDQLEAIKAEKMARKVFQVLKVFRGYTSVTYREEKATVTHSEEVFKDIEP